MEYHIDLDGNLTITVPQDQIWAFMQWINDEWSNSNYETMNKQMYAMQDAIGSDYRD